MTWRGPALSGERADVLSLLDDVLREADPLHDEQPERIAQARLQLAELGLWTVGVPEPLGGGGAARDVALLVLERLGRIWPAVGWACAQAHAAAQVAGADDRLSDLLSAIHDATGSVVVVEGDADHVRLERDGDRLVGTIDRVDPAGESPTVVVLDVDGATVLPAESLVSRAVERIGLGGARTLSFAVEATDPLRIGFGAESARSWLRLGAAAIAAGIAGAAVDGAIDYAQGREQFGGPLTELATVRASLQTQAAQTSNVLSATLGVDAEATSQTAGIATSACDAAVDVAAAALQTHGGYGYLTEYPAERLLRDAVSLRAAANPYAATVTAGRALVGLSTPDPRKDRS